MSTLVVFGGALGVISSPVILLARRSAFLQVLARLIALVVDVVAAIRVRKEADRNLRGAGKPVNADVVTCSLANASTTPEASGGLKPTSNMCQPLAEFAPCGTTFAEAMDGEGL